MQKLEGKTEKMLIYITIFSVTVVGIIYYLLLGKKPINAENFMSFIGYSSFTTTAVWYLWNHVLWKIKIFQKIVGIPNISGRWEGYYQREKESTDGKKHRYVLEVKQTYNSISCITYHDNNSISHSVLVGICSNCTECFLKFTWNGVRSLNETDETLRSKPYTGVTILSLGSNFLKADRGDEITGVYFTDGLTKGKVEVNYFGPELLGKYERDGMNDYSSEEETECQS